MGSFGYICKGCGTSINGNALSGGEKCVMIHVRNGMEIGRVEGHYDEYGRVIEQERLSETEKYRGDSDSLNSHSAICESEYSLNDSYYRLQGLRVYKGYEVDFTQFTSVVRNELLAFYDITKTEGLLELMESLGILKEQYKSLPIPARTNYSGTAAWHSRCYKLATPEAKINLAPSETDPNQSWGKIRKKYR